MEFIYQVFTSGLEVILFIGVMVGGTLIGKKIRDKKDKKEAASEI